MTRFLTAILIGLLGLSALTGCGGSSFNGSLTGRNGNGGGVTVPPGQAQITAVSPSLANAGSAGFTMSVTGVNFLSTTTVVWNNTTLVTTYLSPTSLSAVVPATLLAYPAVASIDPSPIQTFNFGVSFPVNTQAVLGNSAFTVSKLTVAASDLVWDVASQQIFLSVAGTNPVNANTVSALNPQTATLQSSVTPSSPPDRLAVSNDGIYLYAGLDAAGSVQRYTLPALLSDLTIPMGSNSTGNLYAVDLQVAPTSAHTLAVSRGVLGHNPPEVGGVAIYDDSIARAQSVPGLNSVGAPNPIHSLVWNATAQNLYGIDAEGGYDIYPMTVSPTGVTLQTQIASNMQPFGNHIHTDSTTGYLYTDTGQVIDPTTQAVIASFPLNAVQNGFLNPPILVTDGKLNIAYFLGQTYSSPGSGNYVIEAFDLTQYTFLGAITIPNIAGVPIKLIRWGTNGLAFLTSDVYKTGATGEGVYLVSGGFVTSPPL